MLSVMQITTRLQEKKAFTGQLEKIFQAGLTEKQGPIMLYRMLIRDEDHPNGCFTPEELESFPIPGSKPPEQEKGEKDADYRKRLATLNQEYDYIPETTRNGEKIPAHYRWNDIADGLNDDNIVEKERIGKFLSAKELTEANAVPGADMFRRMTRVQLKDKKDTHHKKQGVFRLNVRRAFELVLQIQRIVDDYPSVIVKFNVVKNVDADEDGYQPLATTSKPIHIVDATDMEIGTPLTVASFLRLNVDEAKADPVHGGTYDALLASGGKKEPETPVGDGGGIDLISPAIADGYIAQLARFTEGKRGIEALTVMLTEKDNKEFILSFGDFFYSADSVFKGRVAQSYLKYRDERDAVEKAKAEQRQRQAEEAIDKTKEQLRERAENVANVS